MSQKRSPRYHSLFIAIFITIMGGSSVMAQPGHDESSEIVRLRAELDQLKREIGSTLGEREGASPAFHDDRVRSIGVHRRRPAPVIDQTLQIRMYDVSDVFIVSPHYRATFPPMPGSLTSFDNEGEMQSGAEQFGGGVGGGFSHSPIPYSPPKQLSSGSIGVSSAQISISQLVSAITKTVEPDQWGNQKDQASIQILGNTLLISATPDMHDQIVSLLNLFREHWGKRRTTSVQTFWIRASKTDAAELLDSATQESIGAGVVDPKKWKAFLAEAKSNQRIVFSATLTGHNNQTLHTTAVRQVLMTVDARPIEQTTVQYDEEGNESETNQVVGLAPVRQVAYLGPIFQVTPQATRGGNFVVLDLHAMLIEPVPAEEDASPAHVFLAHGDKVTEMKLDAGKLAIRRFETTLRCPKEQIVLAGAMTCDDDKTNLSPNILLFVKTTVHTITEDKSDWSMPQAPNRASKKKPKPKTTP